MNKECLVITNPMIAANKSAQVTISKFLRVISPCYDKITLIGGNIKIEKDLGAIEIYSLAIKRAPNKFKRIIDIFLLQIKMAKYVWEKADKQVPIYFWVADKMIFPYLCARLKKMDIRYFIYGNVMKEGIYSLFSKISGSLIAYMANHANSVCVESNGVLNEWNAIIKPKKVRNIHLYTNIPKEINMKRRNAIGMLCRLTEGKHVLESIKAFEKFHQFHPAYILEIIGSGRQEEECRQLIKMYHAEDYIKMFGWVEHDQVKELTAEWKFLLFPTDTEGMPNSVIEMMSQGIPVITSPVGGLSDIVVDKKNGFILNNVQCEEIFEKLMMTSMDVKDYEEMCYAAYHTIEHNFTLEKAQQNAYLNI